MALALLDLCAADLPDDAVHLPGDSAPTAAHRPEAGDQLARVFVRQSRLELDLWRARSGGAIELVGIRSDRGHARDRRVPAHRHYHSSMGVAQPTGGYSVSPAEKHTHSGGQLILIPVRVARHRLTVSSLSRRDTGLSPA